MIDINELNVENWTADEMEGFLLRAARRAALDVAQALTERYEDLLSSASHLADENKDDIQAQVKLIWEMKKWEYMSISTSHALQHTLRFLDCHRNMNTLAKHKPELIFDDDNIIMARHIGDNEGSP